jgi:hypothetical protein
MPAAAGVSVAAAAFAALLISEHTPLFGFSEHGYRFVIVLALASDAVAMAMLPLFLARAGADRRVSRTAAAAEPAERAAGAARRRHESRPTTEG